MHIHHGNLGDFAQQDLSFINILQLNSFSCGAVCHLYEVTVLLTFPLNPRINAGNGLWFIAQPTEAPRGYGHHYISFTNNA